MIPIIKSKIAELEKGCGYTNSDMFNICGEKVIGYNNDITYYFCPVCNAQIFAWKEFLILAENNLQKIKELKCYCELCAFSEQHKLKDKLVSLEDIKEVFGGQT